MSKLARLLQARSAAVIGGRDAAAVVRQLRRIAFPGPIWPVNPNRVEMAGLACHPTVAALPGPPDIAFVAVPREAAIATVGALRAIGAGGAVCYASGFGETGALGAALEQQLIAAADGMPVFGPNCYGFVNYLDRVAMWPDEHGGKPVGRGAVIVTQSGNMGLNLTMQRRGLTLAGLYTLGNQATISMADMVAALAHDRRVTAIGLHIEGLGDVQAFATAAEAARAAAIPIVAIKTGRSAAGARIAESHTSSLAGPDSFYDALFERLGIARVASVTALVETLKLLHFGGPLSGNRIASLSCSGGEAALVADLAEPLGLELPPLAPGHCEQVRATLNTYVAIANPLDYHTFIWNDETALTACFTAMMAGGFDATMLVLDFPNGGDPAPWLKAARAMAEAARQTKSRGLVVATLPECFPEAMRDEVAASGLAPMMGLDDCLSALAGASSIGLAWRQEMVPLHLCLPAAGAPGTACDEADAKRLLSQHGVPVPRGRLCARGEVLAAAREVGFPVVLKAVAATLSHKTEAGAVAIGIADEDRLASALAAMAALSDRFLVEEMIDDGVAELIVGVVPDAQFGLVLVIGSGGVLAELVGDTVTLILPACEARVRSALGELRAATLLAGYRGGPAGDIDAAVAAIMAIATLARHRHATLGGLEVNPLIVRPRGVCAVDAWVKD